MLLWKLLLSICLEWGTDSGVSCDHQENVLAAQNRGSLRVMLGDKFGRTFDTQFKEELCVWGNHAGCLIMVFGNRTLILGIYLSLALQQSHVDFCKCCHQGLFKVTWWVTEKLCLYQASATAALKDKGSWGGGLVASKLALQEWRPLQSPIITNLSTWCTQISLAHSTHTWT